MAESAKTAHSSLPALLLTLNDEHSVANALGYKRVSVCPVSPRDKLRPGIEFTTDLLDAMEETDGRALATLVVYCPKIYETPWQAACYAVQWNIAPRYVQSFLSQVFEVWRCSFRRTSDDVVKTRHSQGSTKSTPYDWILRLLSTLLDDATNGRQLVILATLLQQSATLQQSSSHQVVVLLQTILDTIFQKHRLRPSRALIQALLTVRQHWSPRMYRIVRTWVATASPSHQWIELTRTGSLRSFGMWCDVWLQSLQQQQSSCVTELADGLAALSLGTLQEWRHWLCCSISTTTSNHPAWTMAILLLLVHEAVGQRTSYVVGFNASKRRTAVVEEDDNDDIWSCLLELSGCEVKEELISNKNDDFTLVYLGNGKVASKDSLVNETSCSSNGISTLVYQSIWKGHHPQQQPQEGGACPETERLARCWVRVALAAATNENTLPPSSAALLGVLVTVYAEVPAVRLSLMERFVCKEDDRRSRDVLATLASQVANSVVASRLLPKEEEEEEDLDLDTLSSLLLQTSLPLETFCSLARALSKLPASSSGKRTLWRIAQNIAQNVSTGTILLGNSEEYIKKVLYAQFVLVCDSAWDDDIQLEAWVLLSVVIVQNDVLLGCEMRRWLFGRIKEETLRGRVPEASCKHMLAACASRIWSYTVVADDHDDQVQFAVDLLFQSNGIGDFVQREAALELFDLFFTLSLVAESNIFSRCFNILVCLEDTRSPQLSLKRITRCSLIFDAVVVSLLLCMTGKSSGELGFDTRTHSLFAKAVRDVQRLECELFETKMADTTAPDWLMNLQPVAGVSSASQMPFEAAVPLKLGLVDVALRLLFGMPSRRHDEPYDSESLDLTCLVGQVLQLRKETQRLTHFEQHCGQARLLTLSLGRFCTIAIPSINQVLAGDVRSLDQIAKVVSSVRDFCALFELSPVRKERQVLYGHIKSLWSLYQAGFNETAAVQLVGVLEDHRKRSDRSTYVCGVLLSDHRDVDCILQRLRDSVIEVLSDHIESIDMLLSRQWTNPDMCSVYVCIVSQLSSDLCNGLMGSSGGLTQNMFNGILHCIDVTIQRTHGEFKYASGGELFDRIGDSFLTSSKSLETILCSFHLQQKSLLKKVLFLLLSRLPIAFNRGLISSLVANDTSLVLKKDIFATLACGIFDQLVTILVRKGVASGEGEAEWSTIVGKQHMITHGRLLSIQKSKLAAAGEASKEAPSVRFLAIPHEKVWGWSFDLVFKSYENLFLDSKMILEEEFCNFQTANCQETYLLSRVRDFTHPVEAMLYILGSRRTVEDLPLAIGLPVSTKMSLSSCLESFFLLQDHALRNIFCSETSNGLHLVECTSAVSAWLLCQANGYSIDGAALGWRDAEERSEFGRSSQEGDRQTESALLKSQKRMFSRIDSLRSTIRGLLKTGQEERPSVLRLSATGDEPAPTTNYAAAQILMRVLEPNVSLRACLEAKVRAWDAIFADRGETGKQPSKVRKRRKCETSSTKETTVRNRSVGHNVVDEWLHLDIDDNVKEGTRASRKDSFADLDDFIVEA